MERICLFLVIMVFGAACANSTVNDKTEEVKNTTTDSIVAVAQTNNIDTDSATFLLFAEFVDSFITVANKETYPKIEDRTIERWYKNSQTTSNPYYALGQFEISKDYNACLVGIKDAEGSWTHLWVWDKTKNKFTGSFIYVAADAGDAGENMCQKTWIVDLDKDETPELLQRTMTSYLDIDAAEKDRETTLEDVEVWVFDKTKGQFLKKETVANQQEINSQFIF